MIGYNSQGKRHLGNWDFPQHEHLVSVTLPH